MHVCVSTLSRSTPLKDMNMTMSQYHLNAKPHLKYAYALNTRAIRDMPDNVNGQNRYAVANTLDHSKITDQAMILRKEKKITNQKLNSDVHMTNVHNKLRVCYITDLQ